MKLSFFISSLTGGGAERVICELASYLAGRGYETEILTVTRTENSYALHEKVTVVSLDDAMRRFPKPLRVGLKMGNLLRYILRNRDNAFVIFLPRTVASFMLFRPFVRGPVLISERIDPNFHEKSNTKRMLRAAQRADGVVFQTRQAMDFYTARLGDGFNGRVIPNAVVRSFLDPYRGPRRKAIVASGRLDDQKNFPLLIRAFAAVAPDLPEYTLEIYGEGDRREALAALAGELGLSGRVLLPGYVPDIKEHIRDAALFVLSSDYEGMPNALMEAMALGLPCVSTDCGGGGARFLIEDGKTGLLVPVGDVPALAAAMAGLLRDGDRARRLGENAAESMRRFAPERIYAQWEDFLLSLSGQPEKGRTS